MTRSVEGEPGHDGDHNHHGPSVPTRHVGQPRRPQTLYFITSNPNKLAEVREILARGVPGLDVQSRSFDVDEIQGTIEEIATDKCRRAAVLVDGPVLTEDTALEFVALNGMPGPYMWVYQTLCFPLPPPSPPQTKRPKVPGFSLNFSPLPLLLLHNMTLDPFTWRFALCILRILFSVQVM